MKLIVGLGNPGLKYKNTWHNLGFLALDNFIKENKLEKFKKDKKLQAEISVSQLDGQKVILAKPLTFMNNSGQTVQNIAKYYKISPRSITIVHDDIDLPLGKQRVANDSSAGGHNGVKSVIGHLGTQEFTRLKIGVATDVMEKMDAASYVLQKFGRKNKQEVFIQIQKATETLRESVTS